MEEKSFTIIELLVVIAVIGLLSSVVLVQLIGTDDKARVAQCQQQVKAGLVGYWPFDEAAGNSVFDLSSNLNEGTWYGSGSHWADGKIGKAGQFNGSDDYVSAGNNASLDMDTNDFTVEVWAKAINGITGRGIINKGGWGSIGYFISEAYSPANTYYFGVRDSVGYKPISFAGETWGWSHIVGIKTANHLEVWVNGVKGNQYDGAIGSLSNPAKVFEIGRSFNPYYFNGSIDEVRIYNRALGPSEIKCHYELKHLGNT